jgi:hypothetical protein
MIIDLLSIPSRRTTIVPELVRFFDGDEAEIIRFIRTFSGTSFELPGPEFILELRRDEEIFSSLDEDDSIENRLRLLRVHRLDYDYIQNIYRVCAGQNLKPPPTRSRKDAIDQASVEMRKYPSLVDDICTMFVLTANERSQAIELTGGIKLRAKPKEDERALTEPQRRLVLTLKRHGRKSVDPTDLRARPKPRTVRVLVERGFITELRSGKLKLTTRGYKVV